ncbi:MAG: hypothetical protein GY811_18835 [Myxococcales bacterium]|nr:hypothetical protein [Myxococcales bacterium]
MDVGFLLPGDASRRSAPSTRKREVLAALLRMPSMRLYLHLAQKSSDGSSTPPNPTPIRSAFLRIGEPAELLRQDSSL